MTDIPKDIWKTADALAKEVLEHDYCELYDDSTVEKFAKVILAERRRCAKIAVDFHNPFIARVIYEPIFSETPSPQTSADTTDRPQ